MQFRVYPVAATIAVPASAVVSRLMSTRNRSHPGHWFVREWIFRDSKGSDPFYRWLQMKQTFIRSGRKTAFSETTNEEKSNLLKTRLYGSLLNCTGTAGGWALPYTSRISAVRVGASDFRYSQSDHGSAPIKIA